MWWAVMLSFAYWGAQLVLVSRFAQRVPPIASLRDPAPSRWPLLSIVVPARDEEQDIAAALTSKLQCGYANLEVVAVDDRSSDRTGAIMDQAAQVDDRLRVVHIRSLPDGWLGKLHAMQCGLERSKGDWVLFSDADVWLEGAALEPLLAHAEANNLDFIGVLPGLDRSTLLVDTILASFMRSICLLGRMWLANDDRSNIGVGVGAFNLVRRRALERTPGLSFLRLEIADDMALGAMMKACGARCRLFAGRRAVHLLFYANLRAAARSWEKFGTVFEFSLWRPVLFVGFQLGLELLIPLMAITWGGTAAWLGAASLTLATATHALLTRHLSLQWRGVIAWPLGALGLSLLTLRAAFVTWRAQGIRWRSTFYPAAALLAGRRFYAGAIDMRALAESRTQPQKRVDGDGDHDAGAGV